MNTSAVTHQSLQGVFVLNKEMILEHWEQKMRSAFPRIDNESSDALRNSLPEFLDQINYNLLKQSGQPQTLGAEINAWEHAEDRISFEGWSLDRIISEYHFLRESIFEIEGERLKNDFEALTIVLSNIETGIKKAATHYSYSINTEAKKKDDEIVKMLVSLIQESEDFIGISDLNMKPLFINKEGLNWIGLDDITEAHGHTCSHFISSRDVKKLVNEILPQREKIGFWKGEIHWRNFKTGKKMAAYSNFFTIKDKTTNLPIAYATITRDMREFVQNRNDLEKSIRILSEEKSLRERFVRGLAHDLRTPIMAVKMSAQLIERKVPDSNLKRVSGKISQSMDRMDDMIQNLLDANKIRAGHSIELTFEKTNLNSLMGQVLEDMQRIHGDRFRFNAREEIEGNWHPKSLRRILENLLSNAIKYGSTLEPVTITIRKDIQEIFISVHNCGQHLTPEESQQIFNPFTRAGSAKNSKKQGWGIGLTLVKGLVKAHKGKVFVDSAPLIGTTFTVMIPLDSSGKNLAPNLSSV